MGASSVVLAARSTTATFPVSIMVTYTRRLPTAAEPSPSSPLSGMVATTALAVVSMTVTASRGTVKRS
jgi:hypothetical protein